MVHDQVCVDNITSNTVIEEDSSSTVDMDSVPVEHTQ